MIEQRYELGFRQHPGNDPGIVLGDDGITRVVFPGGVRVPLLQPGIPGAFGNNSNDDSLALQARLDVLIPGEILDLGSLTYRVSSRLVLSVPDVTLQNGTFVAGEHTVFEVGPAATGAKFWNVGFVRASTSNVGESPIEMYSEPADDMSAVVVNAIDVSFDRCHFSGARLANLYAVAGGATNLRVSYCSFVNPSAQQNACAIYGASGAGVFNDGFLIERNKILSTGCPDGILLFNARECTVIYNQVSGMTVLPTVTLGPWTSMGSNVWRALDRTDGSTRSLFDAGVSQFENETTPTTPAEGEWGVESIYVYYYKATDPGSNDVTSKILGGYGITIYVSRDELYCRNNLIAYNWIYDTDGSGIYLQLGTPGSHGNQTRGNVIQNVCRVGAQTLQHPWAGIGVVGGLDTLLDGDRIDTTGGTGGTETPGVKVANGGTGRGVNLVIRSAAAQSVEVGPVTDYWRWSGCKSSGAGSYPFYAPPGLENTFFEYCESYFDGLIHGGIQIGTKLVGSPEGVLTAEKGSQVINNDPGLPASLFIKESGSGNTGWVEK